MKRKIDFGPSFGESIEGIESKLNLPTDSKVRSSEMWEKEEPIEEAKLSGGFTWRLVPFYIFIFLLMSILVARAFKLEVIEGQTFLNKSQGNHVLVKTSHAPRGVIYDRNGKVLVRNKPGYRLAVRKIDLPKSWEEQIIKVSSLIGVNKDLVINEIKGSVKDSITIATNLTNDQIISLQTRNEEFPWLDIEIEPKREYLYGDVLGPLLGFTSEASKEDLQQSAKTPYSSGDQVGKTGIEASFEDILRGSNGYQLIKIDSKGKKRGDLIDTKPVAGNDITLSIDIDLQKYVYDNLKQILKDKGGQGASAVVMNPANGEVLALVSVPSFDNNLFASPLSTQEYQRIINDPGHLLLNRPLGASFPPASTFKLIVGSAGLETGKITKTTKITDTGFITIGDTTFNNWLWLSNQRKEGDIDVVRALARSNDVFFWRLGELLGQENIASEARLFGLGKPTGIELPGEIAGVVPDTAWKKKTFGTIWYPGETLNYAIGQGNLLATPLQINVMTGVFANGGKVIKPTILRTNSPKIVRENFISPDNLTTIREGMFQNTVGDGNVSYLFRDYKIKTGGKTGSAEAGGVDSKPDAWYTAFAPFDNPKISVTVMIERGGHGADLSAPLIKKIFDWYFK